MRTPAPAELASWWRQLNDPVLDVLVTRAVQGNLDIAQARAGLRQAREATREASAALLPSVSGSGGAGRNFSNTADDTNSVSLGATAAWEIDLFGGTRRSIEAASADARSSGYTLAATQVSIIAEVVINYVTARQAQEQLAIARDTLATLDENLQITRWRVMAGLAASLDEEQARAQRAQTAASIPTIEQQYRGALNRIAVLTGEAPGEATRQIETVAPLPVAPSAIATGIPADVLRQRPDVRASERALAAQTARIGVAQAALYPALRISGDIGTSALSVGRLADVVTGSLFAGLSQLLFDGGAAQARVRQQRAATDAAFSAYRQNVLIALEDVENGLVAMRATGARQRENAIALDAARNAAVLARIQYRAGLTDFVTLLEAERSLLSSRTNEASARADKVLAVVQLYRAMGGGWNSDQEVTK